MQADAGIHEAGGFELLGVVQVAAVEDDRLLHLVFHELEIGIAEGTLKDIETDAMRKVDEATAIAKASPVPALDAIEKNVWADGGAAWRN